MKSKVNSFAFLMELIIVILFFAIATTICTSFIVMAKKHQEEASWIQDSLVEAQNLIESWQDDRSLVADSLVDFQKIDDNSYQKEHLIIEFKQSNQGVIKIVIDDQIIGKLEFYINGKKE